MNTHLTRLAVILCMAVQAWLGCARGPGMFVCVHTHFADAALEAHDAADDNHDSCCDHHRPIVSPAQKQPPAHHEDCPSCIDLTLPGAAVLTGRDVATDDLVRALDAVILSVPLLFDATVALPAQRCPPWGAGGHQPPDSAKVRTACGIATTCLLV